MAHLGGAIRNVPRDASAFEGRDAEFENNINACWTNPTQGPRDVEWMRAFWAAMEPYSTGGVYVNFLSDEGEARVRGLRLEVSATDASENVDTSEFSDV